MNFKTDDGLPSIEFILSRYRVAVMRPIAYVWRGHKVSAGCPSKSRCNSCTGSGKGDWGSRRWRVWAGVPGGKVEVQAVLQAGCARVERKSCRRWPYGSHTGSLSVTLAGSLVLRWTHKALMQREQHIAGSGHRFGRVDVAAHPSLTS